MGDSNPAQHVHVVHTPSTKSFDLINNDTNKKIGVLEYAFSKPGVVELYHTEVEPSMNGRGYGGLLAKTCFEHFLRPREEGDGRLVLGVPIKQVHATCSYLVRWIETKGQDYLQDKRLSLYKEKL